MEIRRRRLKARGQPTGAADDPDVLADRGEEDVGRCGEQRVGGDKRKRTIASRHRVVRSCLAGDVFEDKVVRAVPRHLVGPTAPGLTEPPGGTQRLRQITECAVRERPPAERIGRT